MNQLEHSITGTVRKCRHHNRGYCKFGDNCIFFHSNDVCQDFLESGICRARECGKRHPKDCRYWKRKEGCRRNDLCRYLHNESKRYYVTNEITTTNDSNTSSNTIIPPQHHHDSAALESSLTYTCDIPDTSYNSNSELIEHDNNRHRNYSCEQCEFISYGQFMMQDHMTTDHMSTSHLHLACDECEFVAKNKGGLTRHRNARHGNHSDPKEQRTEDREAPSFLTINFPGQFLLN